MTTVAQLEESISSLPESSFLELLTWMNERHLDVLKSEETYESPELEEAMLKALDSPVQPMDEAFFEGVRLRWKAKKAARTKLEASQSC